MKRKVIGALQARLSSVRLPGKVLYEVLGQPLLMHQIHRLSTSKKLDGLWVLTSTHPSDDELAKLLEARGVRVFRGDLDDVLGRFYDFSAHLGLSGDDVMVRLTGDCPLLEGALVDETLEAFNPQGYLSNCYPRLYPDGLDVEVFSVGLLHRAFKEATLPYDKEHVTAFMRKITPLQTLPKSPLLPHARITLDTPEDLEVIRGVFEHFGHADFDIPRLMAYLASKEQ